jgi:phospholipid transport system substrate-binding protein
MTARLCLRATAVALTVIAVIGSPAWAGAPTDALRDHIDRIFALLDDPALKGADHVAAQHRALRALTVKAVDFQGAAQRSLGLHWDARTPDERAYFVQLFTDLIDHAYLTRMAHDGERLAYDEEKTTGKDAVVRARALAKNGDATPVVFSLLQSADGQWRIYDVSFEGMSLVGNYRAQFNKIIRGSSYDELVSRLESKTRTDAQASLSTTGAPSKTSTP